MTDFDGIPVAAVDFYRGLEADNSKAYWSAHKDVYESAVRAPLVALASRLADEFGEATLFRPYRDVRFSADKSPYKTNQGAWFSRGGYVSIGADGLFVAGGYHVMAPDQLQRYRSAVDEASSGEALDAVVSGLRRSGFALSGVAMKTRPRGIAAEHPRLELLRYRSLTAHREFGIPDWLPTPVAADRVRKTLRSLAPLSAWLDEHVGRTDAPPTRR